MTGLVSEDSHLNCHVLAELIRSMSYAIFKVELPNPYSVSETGIEPWLRALDRYVKEYHLTSIKTRNSMDKF